MNASQSDLTADSEAPDSAYAQVRKQRPSRAELYRFGHLIRLTERLLLELFTEGRLSGTTHTCIGQEICQMGVVRALRHSNDAVLSNHRNHGHFLTYTGDFVGLIAEVMGRSAGACGGIGGSQHLAVRNFHSNGVQGGMTAIGVGLAKARQIRGDGSVVVSIIGDGTLGQGLVYESLNLAAVWKLPILFVVENNSIAQTTMTSETTAGDIVDRGRAFGIRTWRLDDSRPDFFERAEDVVEQVREGNCPGLLVIDAQRLGPHSKGDDLRSPEVLAGIQARDPLLQLGRELAPVERDEIETRNEESVRQFRKMAEASPEADRLVSESSIIRPSRRRALAPLAAGGNVRAQLNLALEKLLQLFPDVVLVGEDLHDPYGGAFKVSSGLSTKYPGRVVSTPISEAGIVGAGVGLALSGFRPVVEIMFADFVTLALDQIYNHAVKFPGMFEHAEVPLVIRTPSGGRRGYGPTHSQCPESLLSAVPGLSVIYPSHRHRVGDILMNAVVNWPNPSVFVEHKLLYSEKVDPADYESLPSQDAGTELFPTLVRRAGPEPDVAIVCFGGMLPMVEELATELMGEELSVEIVVPGLISPLPERELIDCLMDCPCIAVFEEGHSGAGVGTVLGAALAEAGYKGRFARLFAPPVPIPAARSLESRIIPGRRQMLDTVISLLSRRH